MTSSSTDEYDVIVIGGGPVGENAAQYAIQGSDRTAVIVEHELVGGECSYWACMPSKALLLPGSVLNQARSMPGVREIVGDSPLDVDAVLARRDTYTHDLDDSSQVEWAEGAGMDVVRGHGRLSGEKEVTVGDRVLRARHAVIVATGTTATVPPVPGLREALPWTSRDATNLHEVPERIVVVGGGVVACESATWLLSLGAEVTMVVRGKSLLAGSEPFAGSAVADALTAAGARIMFESEASNVSRPDARDTGYGRIHGGPISVTVGDDTLEVDEILVAAGRRPATKDLGLDADLGLAGPTAGEKKGLTPGESITVDDHLTAAGEWLYAVGDVNGRALLTHMGKYQGRVCGDVIAARADGKPLDDSRFRASADHGQVPQVVFTTPEVASVGLTAKQARAAGTPVNVVEMDIVVAGSSLRQDDFAGRASMVVDTSKNVIVGFTLVGQGVSELLHAATIAVVGAVPLDTLWHAVPSYPTMSEVWLRLLESARG
ncbi:MAG: NAD(P)/FAD-dependent oxidoreductase [Rhodococcus sp. (in: high G+C Gram-positive bacteria)]